MTDVFKNLPRFSWRGIELPLIKRSAGFNHNKVTHKFDQRSGELVEVVGTSNLGFSYTVPFRQDIAKGPYRNLFTETLPLFFEAMRNKEPGELVDPVLGPWRCTPDDFHDESEVNRRDGDDVSVNFTHSPDGLELDDAEINAANLQGATTQAGALDAEVAKIVTEVEENIAEGVEVDPALLEKFRQQAPPEPLFNPLSVASGLLRQAQRGGQRIDALIADTTFRALALEEAIDDVSDPQLWAVSRQSRTLRRNLQRISFQRSQARPLRVTKLGYPPPDRHPRLRGNHPAGNSAVERGAR